MLYTADEGVILDSTEDSKLGEKEEWAPWEQFAQGLLNFRIRLHVAINLIHVPLPAQPPETADQHNQVSTVKR